MTNLLPRRTLRLGLAGLTAAALLTLGACSQDDAGSPTTTTQVSSVDPASQSPSTDTSSTETSSTDTSSTGAPSTNTSSTNTSSTDTSSESSPSQSGKGGATHTDESLLAVLSKVKVDGAPLKPLVVSQVRAGSGKYPIEVTPAQCQYAATGLLPTIAEGNPAAVGATKTLTVGATMVDMGSEAAAKKVLAKRDALLDNPKCKSLTMVSATGVNQKTEISEQKTDGAGLDDARVMISKSTVQGQSIQQAGLTGRKGTVVVAVNVPAGDNSTMKEITTQLVAGLK